MGTATLVTSSIVVVVLVILLFVGFKWVKPESLRLKVWNWLESEIRPQDSRSRRTRHQNASVG